MTKGVSKLGSQTPAKSDIVADIKRGLADMTAGRVIPHSEAMRRLRLIVEKAKKKTRDPTAADTDPSLSS